MVHLLILSILTIVYLGCGGVTAGAIKPATTTTSNDHPLIQWPVGCSEYAEPVSGRYPRPYRIHFQGSTYEFTCRSLCSSRQDCGGFVMYVSGTTSQCYLYNINDDVISDHLNDNSWWYTDSRFTWHSKACRPCATPGITSLLYSLCACVVMSDSVGASDLSCNVYKKKYEVNRYITTSSSSGWRITYAFIPNLTPEHCQTWCTLYPGCKSVAYQQTSAAGDGYCNLYSTTIEELINLGQSGDVLQYTGSSYHYITFDRHCLLPVPYEPGQCVTE